MKYESNRYRYITATTRRFQSIAATFVRTSDDNVAEERRARETTDPRSITGDLRPRRGGGRKGLLKARWGEGEGAHGEFEVNRASDLQSGFSLFASLLSGTSSLK